MGLAAGVLAVGAVVSAVGSYQKAQQEKASLGYQSAVAENNAMINQWQAGIAIDNGQKTAQAQDLKARQVFGEQRAALAANGVDLGEGSARDVLTTSKVMSNRDHAQIMDNAMRTAWGYNIQGQDNISNANALKSMKNNISPIRSAGMSLLGGAGQVAGSWDTYAAANGEPSSGQTIKNWFNS